MLPKVATHFLHTTSRAAAGAVHNPLRNVFQTGSSSTGSNLGTWNGPGNSNWGNHGPGTGSAKQNSGSRYYSSFHTAGRAVSQANVVSANVDGSFTQSDETDELVPRRVVIQTPSQSQSKRPRIRSASLSLTKGESLGVLKTVQLHARSRFLHSTLETASSSFKSPPPPLPASRPRRNSVSSSDGLDRPSSPVRQISTTTALDSGSQRVEDLVLRPRRNSTSSADGIDRASLEAPTPVLEKLSSPSHSSSISSVDEFDYSDVSSVETKPTTPPQSPKPSQPRASGLPSTRFPALAEAKESQDPHRVAEAVAQFRATAKNPRTDDFNLALEALYVTRRGESVIPMLEMYNDMLQRSVQPNHQTYNLLMLALTDRDSELEYTLKVLHSLERRNDLFTILEENYEGKQKSLQDRAEILRSEQQDNFASIMRLFHAANNSNWADIPHRLYFQLLRACLFNSNINAALQIFRHIEKGYDKIRVVYYRVLIQAYGKTGDINGADKVFQHFLATAKANRIYVDPASDLLRASIIRTWNSMIETYFRAGLPDKAIGLLDQMMNSEAGPEFGPADVPLPNSMTFTVVLSGFCQSGDIQTAWTWYERLYHQGAELKDPYRPSQQPTKPDIIAASAMIEALARHGMVSEMQEVYTAYRPLIENKSVMPLVVFGATMDRIQGLDDESAKQTLEYLRRDVLTNVSKLYYKHRAALQIGVEYLRRGMLDDALTAYLEFFDRLMQEIRTADPATNIATTTMTVLQSSYTRFLGAFIDAAASQGTLTFRMLLTFMQVGQILGTDLPKRVRKNILHSYAISKARNQLPLTDLTLKDWEKLLVIAVQAERAALTGEVSEGSQVEGYAFGGVLSLLEDFAAFNVEFNNIAPVVISKTIRHLISVYGPNHLVAIFQNLGPVFQHALEESEEIRMLALEGKLHPPPQNVLRNERTQMLLGSYGNLVATPTQTKYVDEALKHNNVRSEVLEAYSRLQQGLGTRKVPGPWVLGKLIQGLGRQGEVEKVKEVYTIAQEVLKAMQLKQGAWRDGWIFVEDSMTIALAHAGDVDSAHVHRTRILEQGAAPSADAYGALILYVKDTTDDASNAMMLYREAQLAGIEMNIYLYNNIISKLAKARKADYALELFHRMKAQGIKPTSITYGALIGACARVGDVQSAETLFAEMVEQKNFKPRVPPYNTMMQLYTMTKPNRERALYFYEQLGKADVQPTAHTYKLLLDAYGSIEPVDIMSMEAVFEQLKADSHVAIQGTHYASLINAYGCVQRDLDKAIAIFDSIPSSQPVLDAVVFEAIINVLVSHRRTDLVPEYINKMNAQGVHMTAYIANFLIKGYSIVGDLESARSLFESLIDPPTGMAAPNNHAPHDPSASSPVGCMEPVYREPSTWEAMVRAELGTGNRDRALDLLQRLKARQYPEAVYNRISGVLVDHSAVTP